MIAGKIRVIDAELGTDTWQTLIGVGPEAKHSSLVMGTALVDMYSTSSEPGYEQRETLDQLRQLAEQGGFARVAVLPHTLPPIDNRTTAQFWHRLGQPLLAWGSLTVGLKGEQMTDLADLADWVVGFTDARPIANWELLRRLLEYVKPLGKPVMLMAQDRNLAGQGVMREGKWSVQCGLAGIPVTAETAVLAGLLELVRLTQTPTHFMRIASARAVALIAQAKADDLPVTASTTWLHLCFSDRATSSYDPRYKVNPPLPSEQDRLALIEGVKTGVIDAIAVDHIAYTYEEKMVAFESAPWGTTGLAEALPQLWRTLVQTQLLPPLTLWQALSSRPAKCLGIPVPKEKIWFDNHTCQLIPAPNYASY
ncbi:MAG: dihydroorotase [Pseudanabaenaceae cyanobacterium]